MNDKICKNCRYSLFMRWLGMYACGNIESGGIYEPHSGNDTCENWEQVICDEVEDA